jgi:hypothetical protein
LKFLSILKQRQGNKKEIVYNDPFDMLADDMIVKQLRAESDILVKEALDEIVNDYIIE